MFWEPHEDLRKVEKLTRSCAMKERGHGVYSTVRKLPHRPSPASNWPPKLLQCQIRQLEARNCFAATPVLELTKPFLSRLVHNHHNMYGQNKYTRLYMIIEIPSSKKDATIYTTVVELYPLCMVVKFITKSILIPLCLSFPTLVTRSGTICGRGAISQSRRSSHFCNIFLGRSRGFDSAA